MTNHTDTKGTAILPDWADQAGVVLRGLSALMPNNVAKLMATLWFKPFMPKPKTHVVNWQDSADQQFSFLNGEVFVFGDQTLPLVVCVHGWRGRAHQMRRFIEPLNQQGFRVALVNLPAHTSSKLNQTHIYECADFLVEIWHQVGEIHGFITHSFGSPVTIMAIEKSALSPKKLAVVAGNFDIQYLLDQYTGAFGLTHIRHKIEQNIIKICDKRIFKDAWQKLNLDTIDKRIQGLNVPINIWQDEQDTEINVILNREICAQLPDAACHEIQGVGHFEILRSAEVIQQVCDYITD